jgi:pyruvyl transferase EpsO
MKIFGIGWAKTGTTTLGHCLEILGHRHQGQRLDLVDDLTTGDLSRILAVAAEAEAFEDWPWILLYRELDAAFPGSRFILTVRDPQRWLKSYHNMLEQPGIVTEDLTRIRRLLYGLPFPDVTAEQLVERYQRHNDDVLNHFRSRPEALLVVDWERGDGWPQLCEFLGRPIPDVPFPHENKGCYELGGRPADGPDTTPRTPSAAAGFPALIARVLAPLLRDVEGVALVGFPHHWNIGDSVIWAGTLQVLRELGIPVRYVCTPKTYDAAELRLHLPAGPVLLTGGGNFGDVYLDEVALRRRVFEDFPDRHVIQLPQSIWFRSAGGRDAVRRLVDGHPAVTLLLREQRSLDVARDLFQTPSLLCPDLALALEGLLPPAPAATRDVMGLMRGDVESLAGPAPADGGGFADWPREEQAWRDGWSEAGRQAWTVVDAWHGIGGNVGGGLPMPAALEAGETLARERTWAGAALLCAGQVVITDRLHAALLAWLAGRPSVLVDSVSGKSRATVETWFTGVAGMHAAADWPTGLDLATRLAGVTPPA